ncbi:uncharacterized protein LOC126367854 isoform X1 [Pectinophora gossypiella]|nr:uncharacterized protein LOC126367854 isoform X1 [Pectinophora gossypiella]
MIGTDATTPIVRALVRDVALSESRPNREALREVSRSRAKELMRKNQEQQESYANKNRRVPRVFQVDDKVFVIKYSQSTGKLDPGMRGPYKVIKSLPNGRYELKLLGGGYGKTTQAAAQYMVPWRGEWCPETCAAFFDNCDDGGTPSSITALDEETQPESIDQAGPSGIAAVGPAAEEEDDSNNNIPESRPCDNTPGLSMPLLD